MSDLQEQEYMSLAEGVGVIPPKYRNKGYDKLEFEPGEGGLGALLAESPQPKNDTMDAFLAGVAAGADPQELAKELRSGGTSANGRRKRGG